MRLGHLLFAITEPMMKGRFIDRQAFRKPNCSESNPPQLPRLWTCNQKVIDSLVTLITKNATHRVRQAMALETDSLDAKSGGDVPNPPSVVKRLSHRTAISQTGRDNRVYGRCQ
uniref:Uncharacterized protein n=1 Tax=Oryza sativa subsp. japonica TaxID=39947 RepID=Q5Z8X8_ORYSJ|nr:hypothetical protein [Oryza sativa Japonica Group]